MIRWFNGGLHLTGTVITVRTEEKEWENEKYTQTPVSISDGEQVHLMRHRPYFKLRWASGVDQYLMRAKEEEAEPNSESCVARCIAKHSSHQPLARRGIAHCQSARGHSLGECFAAEDCQISPDWTDPSIAGDAGWEACATFGKAPWEMRPGPDVSHSTL
jgi:hypothetical protein